VLEGVLDLGLLEVALGLVAAAFGLQARAVGGPPGGLLGAAFDCFGLVRGSGKITREAVLAAALEIIDRRRRRAVNAPPGPRPGPGPDDHLPARTAVRRRDYAVLPLLARLGLRGAEAAGLRLDDIDWRAGEVVICGKGSRIERLPLAASCGRGGVYENAGLFVLLQSRYRRM
jgi:hypothetical protein